MTQNSLHLLSVRRFAPLFITQLFNAFNDNLFKTAMVLFVTYQLYDDPAREAQFGAIAAALFILPFFLFSSASGQLADMRDKGRIIRIIKLAEIAIMAMGAIGFLLPSASLLLIGVFAMGVHSTFFGTIKYAILPQHLNKDEVLSGTGLVEAGTYLAIVGGTIGAGFLAPYPPIIIASSILIVALLGCVAGFQVPPAPPSAQGEPIDWHLVRASIRLVRATMHIPRLFLAIIAISFFWTIGSVLVIIFPPLTKNILGGNEAVASLLLAFFSVGVALGSLIINRLLKNQVSARFCARSAIGMAVFVALLFWVSRHWERHPHHLLTVIEFLHHPDAPWLGLALMGIATMGGMFVVPLYAFLTTTVPANETARTIAANNIVNAGAMVIGSLIAMALIAMGLDAGGLIGLVALMCLFAAWLGHRLYLNEGHMLR